MGMLTVKVERERERDGWLATCIFLRERRGRKSGYCMKKQVPGEWCLESKNQKLFL